MTTEERLEILEQELARAKRRNYWFLAVLGLAVGLFALGWYFAGTTGRAAEGVVEEVRANKFTLLDENGKECAILTMLEGAPGLRLYDENGKPRAGQGVFKGWPGLILHDDNGKLIWYAPR